MEKDHRAMIRHMSEQCAWIHLSRILRDASENKEITPSKVASRFVRFMSDTVNAAMRARNEDEVARILDNKLLSAHGRNIAYRRHTPNRKIEDWVVGEWLKEKDMYKNKTEFSRIFSDLIKQEHGKKISVRTIREKWLKNL
jgi:hypothetical protein